MKFTRPKDVKNPSGLLQYIFFPINAKKSVTLLSKFDSVLSAWVVGIFNLLSLPPVKATAFLSYSNVSLISSRDLLGRCFNCWAAY